MLCLLFFFFLFFFFQAEDGIRDAQESRGLGDVYKRQPLDPYDFALRASAKTWREFGQPIPKPMYHGIWSASFLRDLKIEGNHLILMQNLRNFTVQFELLRKIGVPVK